MANKQMFEDEYERRWMDIRAAAEPDDDKMIIEGYAIVFDQPQTHKYGSYKFTEVIKKGALALTDMKDVPMRYNHNDDVLIMARTRNKSLTLTVDEKGLKVEAELIDTQSNLDLYKCITKSLIDKMSFAFRVADKGSTWTPGEDEDYREVTNIEKLYDVAVVDVPFYDDTSIYARTLELLESDRALLENRRNLDRFRAEQRQALKEKFNFRRNKK
jgi:HK97 family phage prohead protease